MIWIDVVVGGAVPAIVEAEVEGDGGVICTGNGLVGRATRGKSG